MPADIAAAERFVHANARVLDRHRLAVLLHGAPAQPVLDALRAYRNDDGGFGHALEPDVRDPDSEPAAALQALHVLAEAGALDDPMVADLARWIGSVAEPDGGVPFVMPSAAAYPHAPWMVPSDGGSQLTFALAAVLTRAGSNDPWLERGTAWCWNRLEAGDLGAYAVKFALEFLDHADDADRASACIERLRERLAPDGTIPVPGGTEDECLRPLDLSQRPGLRSRALFTAEQIEADLDRLEREQRDDGGWKPDFLAWSDGQAIEWRGILTVAVLGILAAHERVVVPGSVHG